MHRVLKAFLYVETALGLLLAASVLAQPSVDFSALYALFLYAALSLVFFVVATWSLIFRKRLRKLSLAVMLLPVAFIVLPLALQSLLGPALLRKFFALLAVSFVLASTLFCIAKPGKAASRIPAAWFRHRPFNLCIIAMFVAAWLVPVVLSVFIDLRGNNGSTTGLAYVIVFAVMYLLWLSAISLVGGLWGWLGLHAGIEGDHHRLHWWQIGAAAPGLIAGALAIAWQIGSSH